MLDTKMIRNEFDKVAEKLQTRGVAKEDLNLFVDLDEKRRELIRKSELLKQVRNSVSEEIAQLKRNKENAENEINRMKEVGAEVKTIENELEEVEEKLNDLAT